MIAQHRMIRSARRPRIGSPLRVSLSSFAFQLVRDNRSVPRVLSREEPRRVVPTIARPYVRLKLKTSIEREREEEGAWRDKGEENGGAGIRKKKTKIERKKRSTSECSPHLCLDYYMAVPDSRRRNEYTKEELGCVLVLLHASRTLPSCSESDRAPRLKPKFNWKRGETKEERR